jgi:hypothetical protein
MNMNNQQTTTPLHTSNNTYYLTNKDEVLFYETDCTELLAAHKNIVELLSTDAPKALEAALAATKKYNDEPLFAYLLSDAYRRTGNKELSDQVIMNNYRRFPLYPVLRCEYARICLLQNHITEAASAVNYTFDLHALYPKKSQFHILEMTLFQSFFVTYFCTLKNFNRALSYITTNQETGKHLSLTPDLGTMILFSILQENLEKNNIEKLVDILRNDTPYNEAQ